MIKIITIPILLFFANISFAITYSECQEQAFEYGNGKGAETISQECFNLFENNSSKFNNRMSTSGKFNAISARNLAYIGKKNNNNQYEYQILAGEYTYLVNIQTVLFDEVNSEVIILEKNTGDIHFFSSIILGNVSPYRQLKTDLLFGVSDIAVSPTHNYIMALNSATSSILFYSREANIHQPKGKQQIELIKSIHLPGHSIDSITVDESKGELFVLDKKNRKVIVYNINFVNDNPTPIKIINVPSSDTVLDVINFDTAAGKLLY